ncbi:uncharacterized protein LOC123548120 [Mercenaria mercenaria]|uniref:uncharacterized protein LOC123548120 n=1 Tax=Mercenaria mercenaria TaxID=6596 RepID=UPI00234EA907|nr:uncharacterized protein LOC123548120 [Mercenaria mercenaria]
MYRNISLLKDDLNHNMTMTVLPVTIFIGVEAVFGLFGNILILLIYSKRYNQSNFRSIVLSLAIVDLTSCCTTLPGEIFSQMNWYDFEYGWICKVKSYFNIFTAWSSASILLILAFDRHRKICRPLAWQIHPSLAWQMCGVSFILSAFVSIPVTIFWGKQTYIYEIDGYNLTVSVCEKSDQYADGIYPLVYIGSVYMLPVGLMIFVAGSLNFMTARQLFGHDISLEVRSRRLSISATTLTSLSFAADSLNIVGNTTTQNDNNFQQQPNGNANLFTTSKLSADARKSLIVGDSCTNICLTSVTRTNNANKLLNKHGSFCTIQSSDKHADTVMERTASMSADIVTGNSNIRSDNGTDTVSGDTENNKCCIDTENDTNGCHQDGSDTGSCKVNMESINDKAVPNTNRKCNTGTCDSINNYSPDASYENVEGLRQKLAEKHTRTRNLKSRLHRWQKTITMLVLTTVFVFTMSAYVILTSLVAKPESILKELSNSKKVIFFFFWRLYFVNSVVNPILYGFMDPRFRLGFISFIPGCKTKKTNKISRAATSVINDNCKIRFDDQN